MCTDSKVTVDGQTSDDVGDDTGDDAGDDAGDDTGDDAVDDMPSRNEMPSRAERMRCIAGRSVARYVDVGSLLYGCDNPDWPTSNKNCMILSWFLGFCVFWHAHDKLDV